MESDIVVTKHDSRSDLEEILSLNLEAVDTRKMAKPGIREDILPLNLETVGSREMFEPDIADLEFNSRTITECFTSGTEKVSHMVEPDFRANPGGILSVIEIPNPAEASTDTVDFINPDRDDFSSKTTLENPVAEDFRDILEPGRVEFDSGFDTAYKRMSGVEDLRPQASPDRRRYPIVQEPVVVVKPPPEDAKKQ